MLELRFFSELRGRKLNAFWNVHKYVFSLNKNFFCHFHHGFILAKEKSMVKVDHAYKMEVQYIDTMK